MIEPAGSPGPVVTAGESWPTLPYDAWADTLTTLNRWVQMVGKTRLALAPPVNHWWHIALRLNARGIGSPSVQAASGCFEAEFDFLDHALVLRNDGATRRLALAPRSVADFYREYRAALAELGVQAKLFPRPVEMADATPFAEDRVHASYDPDAVRRLWVALTHVARVLEQFRGRFVGKSSPVHFFWGGFDIACTRFNGRTAPTHPGGVPNVGDFVMREGYSHECISAGWWPGGGPFPGMIREPAFYCYAYPEPDGLSRAHVQPAEAYYHPDMREFLLPYEAARTASDPDAAALAFLQSTYESAADLAGWDRAALERQPS